MLGEKVRPVPGCLLQLGHGSVQINDLPTATMAAADAGDPGGQRLVSGAHGP
jgi:hypothetical protein